VRCFTEHNVNEINEDVIRTCMMICRKSKEIKPEQIANEWEVYSLNVLDSSSSLDANVLKPTVDIITLFVFYYSSSS
jgi:hypothetical protein